MIRIRTASGPTSSTITLSLATAIASISALTVSLVIVPGQAASSPKAITAQTEAVSVRSVEGAGEVRRTVRVVYPGPITR